MPINQPEAQAVPTSRRTFLAKAALGGALVTVATAGPLGRLLPVAAQGSPPEAPDLDDPTFMAMAIPLEIAATQAFQAARASEKLDPQWADHALDFQAHHQQAVDGFTQLVELDEPPEADAEILAGTVATIRSAGDQKAVLAALAEMEEVLAATYLWALGGVTDAVTAKVAGQVLASGSQRATFLGLAADGDLAELTPAVASTEGARTDGARTDTGMDSTTTTTDPGAQGNQGETGFSDNTVPNTAEEAGN